MGRRSMTLGGQVGTRRQWMRGWATTQGLRSGVGSFYAFYLFDLKKVMSSCCDAVFAVCGFGTTSYAMIFWT